MSDLISRKDAIEAFGLSEKTKKYGGDHSGYDTMLKYEIQDVLENLPSAEVVTQSEQYKKGFEDAKRAFELEFAREAESIRKQNAQLEVMLNIQKALLAERNWIPCSERLPSVYGEYLATVDGETIEVTYVPETKGLVKGWSTCDAYGYKGLSDDDVIAWRPKPKPYKESEDEE